jgi:Protein of unknown function (DUF2752)
VTRPGSRTALLLGGFVPVGLAAGRYADWLDTQASLCPVSNLTGSSCPLCGGTRAVLYMLSGQPVEALERNSGAAVVLMVTVVLAARLWFGPNSHRQFPAVKPQDDG